jgi:hypothetical protein
LIGYELLTEDEKDKFKDMIRNSFLESDWKEAVDEAEILIAQRQKENEENGEDDENSEDFSTEIKKTFLEIRAELDRKPKINEEEVNISFDFDGSWENYLLDSDSLSQLVERKRQLITIIRDIRRREDKGELDQVRKVGILKIKEELDKDPPIKSEELDNPN